MKEILMIELDDYSVRLIDKPEEARRYTVQTRVNGKGHKWEDNFYSYSYLPAAIRQVADDVEASYKGKRE